VELVQDLLLDWTHGTQVDPSLVEKKPMLEVILLNVELPMMILL
jgi:hypothetical protein